MAAGHTDTTERGRERLICTALALDGDGPTRRGFLARLQGEISKRSTIDVLRHGIKHGPHHVELFYGTWTWRCSSTACRSPPLELKNSLTKQTTADAVEQYKRDRARARGSSSWAGAWSTSRWTTRRSSSVRTSRGGRRALPPARRGPAAAGTRHGVGHRYLIQHSAGSGKSNSIAWLAHQLIGLRKDGAAVFDSIVVVTDRRVLEPKRRTPTSCTTSRPLSTRTRCTATPTWASSSPCT